MPNPLHVSADGLRDAATQLNIDAKQAANVVRTSRATSGKPSSAGIARAGAAIAAFGNAYQGRINSHAGSMHVAEASYTITDDVASDTIARTV